MYGYRVYNDSGCSSLRTEWYTDVTSLTVNNLDPATTYSIEIRACTAEPICSDWTSCVAGTTAPLSPPTNLRVTDTTDTSITWSWDAVSGADVYWYSAYNGGSCQGDPIEAWIAEEESRTVNNLAPGTTYSFIVLACNSSDCSDESSCVAGTTALPSTTTTPVSTTTTVSSPELCFSPLSIGFNAEEGGPAPACKTLDIQNCGDGTLSWSILLSTSAGDPQWLSASPTSGSSTGETDSIQVCANPAGLSEGTYWATIDITTNGGNDTVPVWIIIEAADDTTPPEIPASDIKLVVPGMGKYQLEEGVVITLTEGSAAYIEWKNTDNVGVTKRYYTYRKLLSLITHTSDLLTYNGGYEGWNGDWCWLFPHETILQARGAGTYKVHFIAEDAAGNTREVGPYDIKVQY